jgi:hypothetical protein
MAPRAPRVSADAAISILRTRFYERSAADCAALTQYLTEEVAFFRRVPAAVCAAYVKWMEHMQVKGEGAVVVREAGGGCCEQRLERRAVHDVPSGWMLIPTMVTRLAVARPRYEHEGTLGPNSVLRPFNVVSSLFISLTLERGGRRHARVRGAARPLPRVPPRLHRRRGARGGGGGGPPRRAARYRRERGGHLR